MWPRLPACLLSAVLGACAVDGAAPSDHPVPGAPAPRTSVSRADVESAAPPAVAVADPVVPAAVVATPVPFTLRRLDDVPAAPARWAFDLPATEFPARALDPVLSIGGTTITSYRYLPGGVLRFTADDVAVREGAEVTVQYGRDVSTRRSLTRALTRAVAP